MNYIPENERLTLERFFHILVKSDGLGYTLFGSKPVCLSAYFASVPLGNMLRSCDSYAIKNGWTVWKKYENYFPHPSYIIFEEPEMVDGEEIHSIFFINKAKTLEILKKYSQLFSKQLHVHFDPEEFLSKIEKNSSIFKILNQHDELLGVLLG